MAMDVATQMRLTGMASGLDTEAIIQNLGRVNTIRVDAVKRDKQLALWRQESLRNTIGLIQNFQKSSFNVANPSSNFRSATAFAKFNFNLTMKSLGIGENSKTAASKILSVTANGDLKNFNQSVQGVAQLATKDTWNGGNLGLRGISSDGFSLDKLSMAYPRFGVSIDGVSRTIEISQDAIKDILTNNPAREPVYSPIDDGIGLEANHIFMVGVHIDNPDEPGKMISIISHINDILKDTGLDFRDVADFISVGADGKINVDVDAYTGGDQAIIDALDAIDAGVHGSDAFMRHDEPVAGRDNDVAEKFAALVDAEIVRQFGADYKGVVTAENGELKFDKTGSNITIYAATGLESTLEAMGFDKGGMSTTSINHKTLDELFPKFFEEVKDSSNNSIPLRDKDNKIIPGKFQTFDKTLEINGKKITVKAGDTINSLISTVNGADAGVILSFNSASGTFNMTSKDEGTASNIKDFTGETAEFFAKLGFGALQGDGEDVPYTLDTTGRRTMGTNLIAVINGAEFTRQSNTFTHEGMTYTFNATFNAEAFTFDGDTVERDKDGKIDIAGVLAKIAANPEMDEIKIDVGKNTTEMIDSIKAFVEEYNKIIDDLNGLIGGKRDREYLPLSDDEKKAMKEDDIRAYEERAKMGILANDAELSKLLNQMRQAIYQKVEGVGITMADVGITTSPNWKEGGRLVIDEDKLKNALENKYDEVVALFTKSSSIPSSDIAGRAKRSSESGIAQRLNDIFTDAIRTTRDSNNNKGYLIERSGITNDASQMNNAIQRQINKYDDKISALLERWYRQENSYYAMFARMETAMAKMQSQQNSLAQIMAQGGR